MVKTNMKNQGLQQKKLSSSLGHAHVKRVHSDVTQLNSSVGVQSCMLFLSD